MVNADLMPVGFPSSGRGWYGLACCSSVATCAGRRRNTGVRSGSRSEQRTRRI